MRNAWNLALALAAAAFIASAWTWLGSRPAAEDAEPFVAPAQVPFTTATSDLTLVAAFSADCVWCRISAPLWNELRDTLRARQAGSTTVGVSVSSIADAQAFLDERGLTVDSLVGASWGALRSDWALDRVPVTLLVHGNGEVIEGWNGLVDDVRFQEILSVIGEHAPMGGSRIGAREAPQKSPTTQARRKP